MKESRRESHTVRLKHRPIFRAEPWGDNRWVLYEGGSLAGNWTIVTNEELAAKYEKV